MIYLVIFAASAFFLYCSARCRGALAGMLACTGLLLPCLLAGYRDETVGTDVLTYAKWMCLNAQSLAISDFLVQESSVAAPGWNVFTWFSVRLLGGLPGYLFAIELLCLLPVYCGLRRMCPGGEWAGILVWLCLHYAFSLNGMRQCVAMGIVFYGMRYLPQRKPWPFCIVVAIAALFHQTAVIAFAMYPISSAVVYGKSVSRFLGKYKPLVIGSAISVGLVLVFTFGSHIVRFASVLKASYSYQVAHLGEHDISWAGLWILLSVVILWTMVRRLDERRFSGALANGKSACAGISAAEYIKLLKFVLAISAIGAVLWQLNYVAATLGRLGQYGTMALSLGGGCYV